MINKKYIYIITLFLFLIIIKIVNPSLVQKISFINYDFYQKVFNRGEVQNVTIVDIDEKSIAKIGQFPWRRDIYSKILNNLNQFNPSAIAFDIVFSEEDKQNPQDLLLKLQKESDQLISANVLNTNNCEISICDTKLKNKIVIFSAIDNLVKGASGQAIQNMNLLYKFNETMGLK